MSAIAVESLPKFSATVEPPPVALLKLLFGKQITYCLSAVARLGVADHMNDQPARVEDLAAQVGAHAPSLYRVMRLLASVDIFEELHRQHFRLTPLGVLLKSDVPGSFRYLAIQLGDPWSIRAFEHFTDTVSTGIDGVSQAFGKNVFEYLSEHPEQAEHFNRSMTGLSEFLSEAIVSAYDFSGIMCLTDVGGGHGSLLASVLNRNPHLQGVVYDLPEVVAGAYEHPAFRACGDRIQVAAGSFFERVPQGSDAYMMKSIVHDWSDELCVKILTNIRQELPEDGCVLVIEQIVDDASDLTPAKLLDIEMLAMTVGGRERTQSEFEGLFSEAGLQLTKVIPTKSPMSILEARLA
jgi:hypothetical protein